MRLFFIFGLLTISYASLQGQDLNTISLNYIKAYFSLDQDRYAQYMDEAVTWADPTWSEVDPNNKPVSGKEAVLAHLKTATSGITGMSFDIEQHFVSGKVAVFEGMMKYTWTDPNSGKSFDFSIREVSVLEFNNDKIIKHTDYADFRSWIKQYQSQ